MAGVGKTTLASNLPHARTETEPSRRAAIRLACEYRRPRMTRMLSQAKVATAEAFALRRWAVMASCLPVLNGALPGRVTRFLRGLAVVGSELFRALRKHAAALHRTPILQAHPRKPRVKLQHYTKELGDVTNWGSTPIRFCQRLP